MALDFLFKYGVVVDVKDDLDGDRIKVHIRGVDPTNYELDAIPYASPLLPKLVHIKPKVGETVFVFVQDNSDYSEGDRFWVGPLIGQTNNYVYDTIGPRTFLKSGIMNPGSPASQDPENIGVQLENDDTGLIGRGSTDVILKPNEIRIRAGKSLDLRKLNKENPAYIQVKYNPSNKESSINIVSDFINILSHKSADKFNLVDANQLINDEEYKKIIEKAHVLPYGDVLIEFMDIFIKAFSTHVHAYHGLPADLTQIEVKNLLSYDLTKINSKNIRIN